MLHYEFGWKFSSLFSFRFKFIYYRFTSDCVIYYSFLESHIIRVMRGFCFHFGQIQPFFLPKELSSLHTIWRKRFCEALSCCSCICMSVIFVMLLWLGCLLWRGRISPWTGPNIDFASKPKWGNIRQLFGKCKVKFNFSHFSFNESL